MNFIIISMFDFYQGQDEGKLSSSVSVERKINALTFPALSFSV